MSCAVIINLDTDKTQNHSVLMSTIVYCFLGLLKMTCSFSVIKGKYAMRVFISVTNSFTVRNYLKLICLLCGHLLVWLSKKKKTPKTITKIEKRIVRIIYVYIITKLVNNHPCRACTWINIIPHLDAILRWVFKISNSSWHLNVMTNNY